MFESIVANRMLWEQPLLDLWSIPHFLSGVLIAIVFVSLGWSLVSGFFTASLLSILWEAFEYATTISTVEKLSNMVADVVVLVLGYTIAVWFRTHLVGEERRWVARAIVALYVAVVLLGWFSYQQYVLL